jgi:hypothetical protein
VQTTWQDLGNRGKFDQRGTVTLSLMLEDLSLCQSVAVGDYLPAFAQYRYPVHVLGKLFPILAHGLSRFGGMSVFLPTFTGRSARSRSFCAYGESFLHKMRQDFRMPLADYALQI